MTGIVVVGAGVAGVRVVRRLRQRGYSGAVVLMDAQPHLPYDRPPLSKQVLRSERDLPTLLSAEQLVSLDSDWRPGVRATGLDSERRVVLLDGGEEVQYDSLVIATGAKARRIPGLNGQVLRSYDDALALRAHAREGATAVVVGGGVVGCEVAASLRAAGADVHLVDPLPAPMVRVVGPVLGLEVAALHRSHGVELHLGTVVDLHDAGRVVLSDGVELRADVVVEAVGAEPDLDWLDGSRLVVVGGGIPCDRSQLTSAANVYVVGDAAAVDGRRSEHWTAATEQADRAVASILGSDPAPAGPAYWWSDQYDVKLQGLGESDRANEVVLGHAGTGRIGLLGRGGRLVGAVGFGASGPLMQLRDAVAEGHSLVLAAASLTDSVWHPAAGGSACREALLSTIRPDQESA